MKLRVEGRENRRGRGGETVDRRRPGAINFEYYRDGDITMQMQNAPRMCCDLALVFQGAQASRL